MQQVKTTGSLIATFLLVLLILVSMLLFRAFWATHGTILQMLAEGALLTETTQSAGEIETGSVTASGVVMQNCM